MFKSKSFKSKSFKSNDSVTDMCLFGQLSFLAQEFSLQPCGPCQLPLCVSQSALTKALIMDAAAAVTARLLSVEHRFKQFLPHNRLPKLARSHRDIHKSCQGQGPSKDQVPDDFELSAAADTYVHVRQLAAPRSRMPEVLVPKHVHVECIA